MNFRASGILGLAIDDRQILCAEVSPRGMVTRAARFDRSSAQNITFAQFLKNNSLTAQRAVIGFPARWLMAREKQVPPSTQHVAADLLRIQAERQFAGEAKDLALDFAGNPDANQPRTVLLLATLQQHIEEAKKIAEEAGLSLVAITSTTLALSSAIDSDESMLLSLGNESAELTIRSATGPRMLRHLATTNGHTSAQFGAIGTEILKAAAIGASPSGQLLVWDCVGMDASMTQSIEARSGLKLRTIRELPNLPAQSSGEFGPAIALALAGIKPHGLPVNFLKSRLAPRRESRFGRSALIVTAAAILLAAGITSMVWDLYQKNSQLTEINSNVDALKPILKTDQARIDRLNYARGWYENRTPVLDVLKGVTNSFPQLGDVWATTISVHENGKGLLSGRAVDQRSVLAVLDALKRDKRFTDVTLMDMRDAGANSRDTVFSLTFTFTGGQ